MNKKVSKIISKLFLCSIMATNFCANQVIYSAGDSALIKIGSDSGYTITNSQITNGTITYGNTTEDSSPYKIGLISVNNSEIQSLVIPKGFKNTVTSDEYIVSSVASSAFPEDNELRYVKLEYDDKKNFVREISNSKLDFSSATNLEAVYVNFDANYTDDNGVRVKDKFKGISEDKILQYADFSDKTINVSGSKYENNTVTISFDDIIPDGYSGYGYNITRKYANSSGDEKTFDSNGEEVSNFSVSSGKVTFTDSIEQTEEDQEYNYTITAYEPFGTNKKSESIPVSIPAKTVSNPTPQPATPNTPSATTRPTDSSLNDDDDEDETPETETETETLKPNENTQEEENSINQEIDNTESNYQTGDILTKKILIITSIVFIIASISLWIIFNKKRKN